MSIARKNLDWETMFNLCLDQEKARAKKEVSIENADYCSMCGNLCAIKIDNLVK